RGELEDPAERLHRTRPVRHGLRLPRPDRAPRLRFHPAPQSSAKSPSMVTTAPATMPSATSAAPRPEIIADVSHLDFFYGRTQALHDVTLGFEARKVTALIGPSGCGKSTLLRCLNRMNDLIEGARVARGTIFI